MFWMSHKENNFPIHTLILRPVIIMIDLFQRANQIQGCVYLNVQFCFSLNFESSSDASNWKIAIEDAISNALGDDKVG